MPGVLVESSASAPHVFFPFESCFDGSGGLDVSSPRADLTPLSPHSPPLSHVPYLDAIASSPPSPSFRTREIAQRFLPRSNLGLGLNGSSTDFPSECSSELAGVPISSPRKGLYANSCTDAIVGSPLLPDGNSNGVGSPVFPDAFSALHKFLPSNTNDDESLPADIFPAIDAYSCDDFRMYEFKVRRCMRGRSHDWTECPFAHPGEKARRRDPRRIHYSGTACPDFRKGSCKRGDACEYAHGVFECWLHPARYRTQPCKDGRACRRRVCFFAHTVEQLRVLPSASSAVTSPTYCSTGSRSLSTSFDGSPLRQALKGVLLSENANDWATSKEDTALVSPHILLRALEGKGCGSGGYGVTLSPSAVLSAYHAVSSPALSPPLAPSSSPPMSPDVCWQRSLDSPRMHVQSPLATTSVVPGHRRHLNRLQTMPTISIPSEVADYSVDAGSYDDMSFSLPVSAQAHSAHASVSELLQSFQTLQLCSRIQELQKSVSSPSSPQSLNYPLSQHSPLRQCHYNSIPGTPTTDSIWNLTVKHSTEVDPPLRVESGRDLRAKIYGKIGKENGVDCNEDPDLGWVNELVT